jgi:hypothetical protein
MSLPPIEAASCRGSVFHSTGASRARCTLFPPGATGGRTASVRVGTLGLHSRRNRVVERNGDGDDWGVEEPWAMPTLSNFLRLEGGKCHDCI